jgi:hypothetical protein
MQNVWGKCIASLSVKASGTYSNRCALKGYIITCRVSARDLLTGFGLELLTHYTHNYGL